MSEDKHDGAVRVAIVDDSDDLRLMLRLTLQNDGRFRVTGEAADGFGAVDLVESESLDLLLLDLAMPGMDGLTALQKIRQTHQDEPVIVILSAFPPVEYAETAKASGATGYIQKGANLLDLANQVWAQWDSSHLHDPSTTLHVNGDNGSAAETAT